MEPSDELSRGSIMSLTAQAEEQEAAAPPRRLRNRAHRASGAVSDDGGAVTVMRRAQRYPCLIAYRRAFIGLALALAMVMTAAVTGVAAAGAARPSIRSYTVPAAFGPPTVITAGTDGQMWFTESGYNGIARISLDGVIRDFNTHDTAGSNGITPGPDDRVWFTANDGYVEAIDRRGHVQRYPLHVRSGPDSVATGPDGNLWTVPVGNKIGRLTPSGRLRRYAVPGGLGNTGAITAGPDGALWFLNGNAVGRITTSGRVKMYPYTLGVSAYVTIGTIITGPDGNLWFANGNADVIGRVTPQGQITLIRVVAPSAPDASNIAVQAVAAGADGNVWFSAADRGNGDVSASETYGYVTPAGQVFSWVTPALSRVGGVGNNNNVEGIAPGPDGSLWFAAGGGAVAKVTPYPPRPVTAGTLSLRSGSRSLRGGRVRVNLGCVGAAGLFCQGKVSLVDHGRRTLTRGSPYFAIAALPAPANRQLHLAVALGRSARRRLSRGSVTARVIIKSRTGAVIASQTVTLARRH